MRTKIVAGNWKMHKTKKETIAFIEDLSSKLGQHSAEVMVAPTYVNLEAAARAAKGSDIGVLAQNMHFAQSGAYTGEISADMLSDIGISWVILGHSERRSYYNETDTDLAKKMKTATSQGMGVIFCFGELLEERKSGDHFEVVARQLKTALYELPAEAWDRIVLAYEPVWAIGTGETATPEQAQEMHAFIRMKLADNYSDEMANKVRILYGGSVKPGNAAEIFGQPDVDGGLIGGAALVVDDFLAIVAAAG